jgi:hypothetical protein
MPLATPSGIAVSRIYRRLQDPVSVQTENGITIYPPRRFDVYGTITWTNTEETAHAVILTVNGIESYLLSGATKATDVLLGTWTAPETAAKTATVSVVLKSSTETSTAATASPSIAGASAAAFSGNLSVSGNTIVLPGWTGTVTAGADGRLGRFSFNLGNAGNPVFVAASAESVAMPGLIQNEIYRAILVVDSSAMTTRTFSYQILPGVFRSLATYWTAESSLIPNIVFGAATQELFFLAPEPTVAFTAQNITARVLRGAPVRFRLEANYRATWAITSGNPGGFGIEYVPVNFGTALGPDEAYLVGTPTTAGSATINLTATRAGSAGTATATANLTVVDSLPRTTISTNSAIAREGLSVQTNEPVSISFQSVPSPAAWTASGLPPGVTIDQQGNVTGRPARAGVFFASISATATDYDTSIPTTIRFSVSAGVDRRGDSSEAAARVPWLLNQWELTDLQIVARSRVIESTMFESGALRLKLGDAINFAVFFVDSADAVFSLAPSSLRLTIRKADNLDDLIIFKSSAPPTSATTESQTYYLMPVTTGNREREVALEWAEDNGKNEPLQCVADLDWTKDGKVYSSRTFPVLLELDVTRP